MCQCKLIIAFEVKNPAFDVNRKIISGYPVLAKSVYDII